MRRTFLLAALLSGCAFGSSHLDEVDPEAAPATPTWSAHVLPILEHRCTACHADDALPGKAAGYGFGTCAEAKRHWGELYETAFIELSMPPGGAPRLESWEMLTLQRWHDQEAAVIKHFASLAALAILLTASAAQALPLYSARAGRTCDNCHSLPNTWYDPPAMADRKCTLSCAGCHVDPSGGGLRTVSGRYYGETTLPFFGARDRPLADRGHWPDADAAYASPNLGAPSSQPTSGPVKPVAESPVDPRGPDAPPADRGLLTFGRPLLHGSSKMAWLDGRYGDLRADPLLNLGADLRLGFWNFGPLIFPMQTDVYAAVHPVEHLTLNVSVGGRGRARSPVFEGDGRDDQPRFGVRDAWLMTHEWPYLSYARVGRFLPNFGTRVADHTAPIRRAFGMSQEDPANRVIGAEVGFTANYPYFAGSFFKPSTLDARNPFALGDGYGAAVSGGWRDLGWQLGASGMIRRRSLETGGDTTDVSLQWGFNPWRYAEWLPLTYLGEATFGFYQRKFSGKETSQLAAYHELGWAAWPGVIAKLRYDFWEPDTEVVNDEMHRPGLGLDLTVISGLTISADARALFPAGGNPGADIFVQVHGWF